MTNVELIPVTVSFKFSIRAENHVLSIADKYRAKYISSSFFDSVRHLHFVIDENDEFNFLKECKDFLETLNRVETKCQVEQSGCIHGEFCSAGNYE